MTEFVLARLKEGSTWRGIVWLLTALGVTLSPQAWEYVVAAGMAIAGLIGVLSSERAVPPTRPPLIRPPTGYNDRDADAPPSAVTMDCPTAVNHEPLHPGVRRWARDAVAVSPGGLRAADLPSKPNFGVRPPIERPLADQLSGGWGDR